MKCRERFTVLPAAAEAVGEGSVEAVDFQAEDLEAVAGAVGDTMKIINNCSYQCQLLVNSNGSVSPQMFL